MHVEGTVHDVESFPVFPILAPKLSRLIRFQGSFFEFQLPSTTFIHSYNRLNKASSHV